MAVQVEISSFSVDIEDPSIGSLQTAREVDVTIVLPLALKPWCFWASIAHMTTLRRTVSERPLTVFQVSRKNFPKNLELTDGIVTIARKKGVAAGQLTLAWELAQGQDFQ